MTGLISRKLCELLILLYPSDFRREFGNEMLKVFEECSRAQGCSYVFVDLLRSAAKQQIHHFSTAESRGQALYSDIGSSPSLPRMLAISVFATGLIAGVLRHGAEPQNRESWTMGHLEVRFWFPTGTTVLERMSNAPDSWRILRTERSCKR
jgi:hypothetical protein